MTCARPVCELCAAFDRTEALWATPCRKGSSPARAERQSKMAEKRSSRERKSPRFFGHPPGRAKTPLRAGLYPQALKEYYAGYSEENCDQQVEDESCPFPHHECIDKFDDAREHQHPSEKQHRDHGGRDGPNNCDDAGEYQCDPKRQEPSPVLNHLLGDPHYHHIDLT